MEYYKIYTPEDLEGEVWKTHPVFTEYEGSNYGRIRAKERFTVSNWGRGKKNVRPITRRWAPKVLHQQKAFDYLAVSIRRKAYFAHRFLCECWYGMAQGMDVNHINEDKYDNRPDVNLEWVTTQQNMTANNLHIRAASTRKTKRGRPIYVYLIGSRMVKITETLQEMADYFNFTIQAIVYRIKNSSVDANGGKIIKVTTLMTHSSSDSSSPS